MEVNGIVFCRRRILTAGWSKVLRSHDDQFEDDNDMRLLKRSHSDDITCLGKFTFAKGFIFQMFSDTEAQVYRCQIDVFAKIFALLAILVFQLHLNANISNGKYVKDAVFFQFIRDWLNS